MSPVCLSCSTQILLFSREKQSHQFLPSYTSSSSSSSSSSSTSSSLSSTFPLFGSSCTRKFSQNHESVRIGKWVSRRIRVRAKSADSEPNAKSSTSLLSFLCPLLKLFSIEDPSGERNYTLEVATSSLSSLARLPWGSKSLSNGNSSEEIAIGDPPLRLQLFEFEACPFCRRVREAITELDLSVEVYPCPKGSLKHREIVRQFGGKEQFPYLVDPNTGVSMYESGDIVNYLFEQYGQGRKPSPGLMESTLITGWMPTLLRAGRGMALWEKATPSTPPKKLELFSYENNPRARIVREALCELELPYVLQSVGEGSDRSRILVDAAGSKEVPFLIDPNTGTQVSDYKKILSYLFQTYSKDTVVSTPVT